MSTLKTLLANMGHAAFSRQSTRIGGGIFTWKEIGEAVVEIRALESQIEELEKKISSHKRDLPVLGGMMLGYGIGRASQMPDPAVIGVGLITDAESLLRLVAPEEMASEVEGPRQRMAVQGIINAWEERRALARKVWTSGELVSRGFRREHLGEGYEYRLEDGGLEWREADPMVEWQAFDAMADIGEDWQPTLEAIEAWLLSNL